MSSLDYCHSNEVYKVNGKSIWIGDLCSAEDLEHLHKNNIKAGTM